MIANLTPKGHDSWDRPVFQSEDGRWFCCVDLNATLEDVNMGRAALYAKYGGREGEPDYPIRMPDLAEPPTPPGYIIKQDGMGAEWTAIRDNELGEIIACGCETREKAVRFAERDGGLPHTEKVPGKEFYMSVYPGTNSGWFSETGRVATAEPLTVLEPDEKERAVCNQHFQALAKRLK